MVNLYQGTNAKKGVLRLNSQIVYIEKPNKVLICVKNQNIWYLSTKGVFDNHVEGFSDGMRNIAVLIAEPADAGIDMCLRFWDIRDSLWEVLTTLAESQKLGSYGLQMKAIEGWSTRPICFVL